MDCVCVCSDLVAVLTQRDPCLVEVGFPCESSVTLSALEAAAVVRPVQCLDRWLTQGHGLTTEPTHICTHIRSYITVFVRYFY